MKETLCSGPLTVRGSAGKVEPGEEVRLGEPTWRPEPTVVSRDIDLLHRATIDGDDPAREQLAGYLLLRVVRIVRRRMRSLDPATIVDAVEDAVMKYLRQPETFDETRSRLETFVAVQARRNVLDRIRRDKRRRLAEQRAGLLPAPLTGRATLESRQTVTRIINATAWTPMERCFIAARLNGTRSTVELATILGSTGEEAQQRRDVKRVCDRLRARLRRFLNTEGGNSPRHKT